MREILDMLRRRLRGEAEPIVVRKPPRGTDTRFRAVSIRPGEQSCEAARQFGKMRFLCARAPHLPVPECDASVCNCRYVHYADRRSGTDRRAVYDWTRERQLGVVNRRSGRGRRADDAVA